MPLKIFNDLMFVWSGFSIFLAILGTVVFRIFWGVPANGRSGSLALFLSNACIPVEFPNSPTKMRLQYLVAITLLPLALASMIRGGHHEEPQELLTKMANAEDQEEVRALAIVEPLHKEALSEEGDERNLFLHHWHHTFHHSVTKHKVFQIFHHTVGWIHHAFWSHHNTDHHSHNDRNCKNTHHTVHAIRDLASFKHEFVAASCHHFGSWGKTMSPAHWLVSTSDESCENLDVVHCTIQGAEVRCTAQVAPYLYNDWKCDHHSVFVQLQVRCC